MCTATWIRTSDGYEVFFNRDELRTRKPASPPAAIVRAGVSILAPIDGDAGGTWLGANEHGVAIGLANGGPSDIANGGPSDGAAEVVYRSRGLLVLDLLESRDLAEVRRRLETASGTSYRPFSLFAIDAAGGMAIFGEGAAAPRTDGALLFSSSRDPLRARAEREKTLDRMRSEHGGLDADLLRAFHASHEPERGAFSPCMHREDAGTVSFSHVRVSPREILFDYRPGPLCEPSEVATARLGRSR